MKRKKKLLGIMLLGAVIGACAFALVGCGDKDDSVSIIDPDVPLGPTVCSHETLTHETAVAAGCITAGHKEYWFCDDCDSYFADAECKTETSLAAVTLAATGHSYGAWINEDTATCTENGVKGHKDCSVCKKHFDVDNKEITDLVIVAGHTYGNLIAEDAATCEKTGVIAHYHCNACNSDFDAQKKPVTDLVIPLAAHKYGAWIAEDAATCTEDGVKGHKDCSVCKKHFDAENNEIADLTLQAGHNYGTWINEVPATLCENGVKGHYHCSACNKDFDEDKVEFDGLEFPIGNGSLVIYANHNLELVKAKEPTCEEGGVSEDHRHCTECGKNFDTLAMVEVEIMEFDPIDHDYGTWIAEVSATCTEDGVKGHKDCQMCKKHYDAENNEITDLVIVAGHTYGNLIAEDAATCEKTGVIAHYHCNACNSDFDAQKKPVTDLVIPLAAHKYGAWIAEDAATCTEDGVKGHKDCSVCEKHFDAENIEITDLVIVASHAYPDEFTYDYTEKAYKKVCAKDGSHVITQSAGTEEYPYLAKDEQTLTAAMSDGAYIKLADNIAVSGANGVLIQKSVNIDLNGKTITGAYTATQTESPKALWAYGKVTVNVKNGKIVNNSKTKPYAVYSTGGATLTVEDVEISSSYCGAYVAKSSVLNVKGGSIKAVKYGIIAYSGTESAYAVLSVDGTSIDVTECGVQLKKYARGTLVDCDITTVYNADINVASDGIDIWSNATLTMTGGSIASHRYGIVGNGTDTNVTIEITDVTITSYMGIYHPQKGSRLTVNGGSITGSASAIEVRSGIVNINASEKGNAVLISTAKEFSAAANGSGTTTEGMALAISQHTTNEKIVVTLNGATLKGIYALYEKDLMDEIQPKDITVILGEGNTFEGLVYSENCENLSQNAG